jgi:uncharacterized membrane protein
MARRVEDMRQRTTRPETAEVPTESALELSRHANYGSCEKHQTDEGPSAMPLPRQARIESIDLLRGGVMVLMALDHTRDFFGGSGLNPRDVTSPDLFLTRWITHFCAPVFVFLTGTSAWLYGSRGRHPREVSRFLLVRGLFLVVLELTVVRVGWTFHLGADFFFGQVIWVIGWSMVALSALVRLPARVVGLVGMGMIVSHNLLDPLRASSFGPLSWLWTILHEPGTFHPVPGAAFLALYSLIPWVGVMAAGYGFGQLMQHSPVSRQQEMTAIGLGLVAIFVILRASNTYGDPNPWSVHDGVVPTILSFINCEKYPPSLLYLLMTLGPAVALLPFLERIRGIPKHLLLTFGGVPLFYYLIHIPLIHALAVVAAYVTHTETSWLFGGFPPQRKPPGYGFSLPVVYLIWLGILLLLYPICLWFSDVKQRSHDSWLRYL